MRLSALTVLLSFASVPAAGQPATTARQQVAAVTCPDSLRRTLASRAGAALMQRAKAGEVSGVVLVTCNGLPLYEQAIGLADRSRHIANTMETRFNLASMGKMFTAISIAQLVEQGRVSLDAPVGRYVANLSNAAVRDRVTIRQLLSHSSGLGSYFDHGFLGRHVVVQSMRDYLPFFIGDSLAFPPGAHFGYSNAGFAMLGMVIEQVSGLSYYSYVQKNIFERAGMTHAAFVTMSAFPANAAHAYSTPPGESALRSVDDLIEARSGPAGGSYATARDMVAFSRALWSGRLVGLSTLRDFTSGKIPMGPQMEYAFGFGVRTLGTWRSVGHNGGAPGVGTEFLMFPDQHVDVVVLTNQDQPTATDIIAQFAQVLTGASMSAPTRPRQVASPVAAGTSAPVKSDSVARRRLTAFIEAFSGGTATFAPFVETQMAPNPNRTVAQRVEASAPMMRDLGKLTLVEIARESADEIEAVVSASNGDRLTLTISLEHDAPRRVSAIRIVPRGP